MNRVFAIAFVLLFCMFGCESKQARYDRILSESQAQIAVVQQYQKTFPDAHQLLMYSTGEYGQTTWWGVLGFYGRYTLTIHIPLHIDGAGKVIGYEETEFYINQIDQIDRTSGGGFSVKMNSAPIPEFNSDDWELLIQNDGELLAVYPEVDDTAPVPLFDEYLRRTTGH